MRKEQILYTSEYTQIFKIIENGKTFVRKIVRCTDPATIARSLESLIIEHPNICKIYEVRVNSNHFAIDMEYIQGTLLSEYLHQANTSQRLHIISQLVALVSTLYNIQHPYSFVSNNIMVCEGQVKLIGFGIHSHRYANEGEIFRNIAEPYLNLRIFKWWLTKITTQHGSKKLVYMSLFRQFLQSCYCVVRSRYILACVSVALISWFFVKVAVDAELQHIDRVVVIGNDRLSMVYNNVLLRQRIHAAPEDAVRAYLEREGVSSQGMLRHFESQALLYVDAEPLQTRLVYSDGKEQIIFGEKGQDRERLLDRHLARVLSELKWSNMDSSNAYVARTFTLGIYAYALEGSRAAMPYFQICIDQDPSFDYAYINYAKCLRDQGLYSESIQVLMALLRRVAGGNSRSEMIGLSLLGSCHSKNGDYAQALSAYDHALRLSESLGDSLAIARVLNNIGSIHYRLGDTSQSRDAYQRVMQLKQDFGEWQTLATRYNLALLDIRENQIGAATAELERVLDLSKKYRDRKHLASASLALGWLAYTSGDAMRAQALLKEAQHLATLYGFAYLAKDANQRLAIVNAE